MEVAEQAQTILKDTPLLAYYENVLIEALKLAQADADRGLLDGERKQRIRDVVAEVLDDLETHEDAPELVPDQDGGPARPVSSEKAEDRTERAAGPVHSDSKKQVLCIPGRDLLGEAFGLIVAQLLAKEGIGARAEQSDALSVSRIFGLDTKDVELICLCFVGGATSAQIHYAVRRLRRKMPEAFIVLSLIGNSTDFAEDFKLAAGIGSIEKSLGGTRDKIVNVLKNSGQRRQEIEVSPTRDN
jgi:hypothetical protein